MSPTPASGDSSEAQSEARLPVARAGPAERRAGEFERHCVQLTYKQTRFLAILMGLGAFLLWPFDLLLYSRDIVLAFCVWRVAITLLSLLTYLLLRGPERLGTRVFPILFAILTAGAAASGYSAARAGTMDHPWFHAAYMLPLLAVPLLVDLRQRAIGTVAISGAFYASYMIARPDQLAHEHLVSITIFAVFVLGGCVMIGHVYYGLTRESFRQRLELASHAKQLEAADRLKNEFFANVSHEFRTPLMLVMVHLRAMYAADSLHADAALRNCARLLLLVDQLLELARLGTRDTPVRMQRLDLAQLVADVGLAFRQDLAIEGADTSRPAWGDAQQLRTVVYNLLSNAFKFSDPLARRIRLAVHVDERIARIEVSDNGIGIAADKQEEIFERFVQAEQGATRRYGGVGLGLSLVKEIARAHAGTVRVESKLGEGSTFVFEWPQALAEQASADAPIEDDGRQQHLEVFALARSAPEPSSDLPPPPVPLGPRATRVLLVEDDPELRQFLAQALDRVFRIDSAEDGEDALAKVRSQRPDLVVTDLMIPSLSGVDLVRAIRKEPDIARTPVLIITARSGREARVSAYQAGADDFLPKPFDQEELLARAFNLLAVRRKERELAILNADLEERVATRTAELRRLSAHLTRAREEERERLARELHDEAGQLLTGLRFDLAMARKAKDEPARAETHARMEHLLDQSFDVLRRIVSELRPRVLDEMGLAAAVEWYVDTFGARTGIACALELGALPRHVSLVETAAFRIVQETLTNVARHSKAKNVTIRLGTDEEHLSLLVADDGIGFETGERKRGFGLLGMAERAHQIGGAFTIESIPGRGTTTRVKLPLRDARTGDELVSA